MTTRIRFRGADKPVEVRETERWGLRDGVLVIHNTDSDRTEFYAPGWWESIITDESVLDD